MTKTILVPIDGSPQSERALEHALTEFPDAEVTVLNVIDPASAAYDSPMAAGPVGVEEWYENAEEAAEEIFKTARETADGYGKDLDTATEVGQPARTITDYAEDETFDQIVIGSHGRSGVTRILLGSVAETVVRRAPCPVTVVR
jgi:nucleotide-binding universal stress UspA family protein